MHRIITLTATLGLSGIGAAAASTLPGPVEAIITGYVNQCHQLGGNLVDGAGRPQIMTGDFDGDGTPDYVLNPQNLRCSAAATAFCGNGGCQITIALSGHHYQAPITVLGGQPTIVQKPSGLTVEIWVRGSNCSGFDREKACWASYSWIEERATTSYQLRPRPQ
ncbi:MAG TPA: hypothetical protein VKT99_24355 [Xanthobacteraceae bacterium]|jgi:hypothetical protein|nr:hypothetical protein [Xanthobacteraceae bacterium]